MGVRGRTGIVWGRLFLTALAVTLAFSRLDCQPARSLIHVSRAMDGGYANGHCYLPNMTPDGRYIVFESEASNLVPGDTNGKRDIFLYDTMDETIQRLSVGPTGEEADNDSAFATVSVDGRYVAFASFASNLVPGDTNGKRDAFVHDVFTGENAIVSRNVDGELGNDTSSAPVLGTDGRFVPFLSKASNLAPGDSVGSGDVFVKDTLTGEVERLSLGYDGSEPNGVFTQPIDMTPDARYVLFRSRASNLVPGDTNGHRDLFLHDRVTHVTERVNIGPNNEQDDWGVDVWNTPHITPDGRYVAFSSGAKNWYGEDRQVQVYVRDRVVGATEWIPVWRRSQWSSGWLTHNPDISDDGRYVVFDSKADGMIPGDYDGTANIFRYDRETAEYIMVDRDPETDDQFYIGLDPSISSDGKTVAFESWGPRSSPSWYSQIYVAIGLP